MKPYKRYLKDGSAIKVYMWRNENPAFDVNTWEDRVSGDSSFETGASSIGAAMKIVKGGLDRGYTHFTLKYPIAMQGITKNEPDGGK